MKNIQRRAVYARSITRVSALPLRRTIFQSAVMLGLVLGSVGAGKLLATPASQNFDSVAANTHSAVNGSLTLSGVVYSSDAVNDEVMVDTIANITGNLTSLGTGNGLTFTWFGTTGTTYGQIAAADNSNNFKLVSYNAEVFGHVSENSELYAIKGYDNGVEVASATVDFHQSGTYGSGVNTISYNRLTTTQEAASTGGDGANCGTLTFTGSGWNNIDTVRMIVADSPPNTYFTVSIDKLVFADPVLPNSPPTDISLASTSVNESAGANATVGTLSTTDSDSSSFTYSLVSGTGSTDNNSFGISGSTLYAKDASGLAGGTYSVRIQTDDGSGGTYSKAFTITVVDDVAPAAPTSFAASASGSSINLSWVNPVADFASVTIRRSTISYPTAINDGTLVAQNATGTSDSDASLADGTYYYSIFALDSAGNVSTAATASATVDTAAPTVSISAPSTSLTQTGPISFTVTWADTHLDSSSISLTGGQVTVNTTGTVTVNSVNVSGSGTTRTVELQGISGDGTVGISIPANTASDLAGNEAPSAGPSATATVDNTAPTISIGSPSASTTSSGPVDYVVTYSGADAITLSAGDITLNHPDSATGTVTVSGSGTSTRTVTISSITGSGNLGISIAAGTASDTAGNTAAAAGPSSTVTVNTAPILDSDNAAVTVGEGATATNSGTFSDADGNATVTLSASVGTVVADNTAGTWSWSMNTTDGPDDSQTVTITADDGIASSVTTTFALNVTNIAPTANAQTITTPEDTPVNITLTANDPGLDTVTNWTITSAPTNGSLSGTAPDLIYTPGTNFNGSDSFKFTATDSDGATGAEAVVAITVTPVNDPPIAGADSLSRPDTTKMAKITKASLLSNDSDPENDPLSITAVGNALPAGATVKMAGAFVIYTAPATNAGDGSFTYTLSDGTGGHLVDATVSVVETSSASTTADPNSARIVAQGNDYVLTFIGVPGHAYRVQYTTSLSTPYTWNEFSPQVILTAPANGVFQYTDVNPSGPMRLYRVVPNQ